MQNLKLHNLGNISRLNSVTFAHGLSIQQMLAVTTLLRSELKVLSTRSKDSNRLDDKKLVNWYVEAELSIVLMLALSKLITLGQTC